MSQDLLTFAKAAKQIGWTGKWAGLRLKRLVFAREKQTKKRIATRMGSANMPKYRLTMSAMRRHLPELFKSKVDELRENFDVWMESIDDRIAEAAAEHVTEYVEPRLQELWQRDETIAERVNDLGLRVKMLSEARLPSERQRTLANAPEPQGK